MNYTDVILQFSGLRVDELGTVGEIPQLGYTDGVAGQRHRMVSSNPEIMNANAIA